MHGMEYFFNMEFGIPGRHFGTWRWTFVSLKGNEMVLSRSFWTFENDIGDKEWSFRDIRSFFEGPMRWTHKMDLVDNGMKIRKILAGIFLCLF